MTLRPFQPFLLIIALSIFPLRASSSDVPTKSNPPKTLPKSTAELVVYIAAPNNKDGCNPNDNGKPTIWLSMPDPHFDVVIRNASDRTLNFYSECVSGGYDNLHLELLSIDGRVLPKPIIVERKVMSWAGNDACLLQTLEPGESMVREIHLKKNADVVSGIPYLNFPMKSFDFKIRMRAVFVVSSGPPNFKLWTGSVASEAQDYLIREF